MRSTGMGAAQSQQLLLLDYVGVRNWIIFILSALLLAFSEVAAAAQTQREVRFSSYDDSLLTGGGPYVAPRTPVAPAEAAPDATSRPASSSFDPGKYWDALSELNLSALRESAAGDAQVGFARGMSMLADGDVEGAENAFIEGSGQPADINVGIASQIMLATTLLYEHKWTELRAFAYRPNVTAADKEILRDYQRWGFAFANTEPQRMSMAADSLVLPLGVSPIGTPTLRVIINGKQYDFWLDTGSSITVLNSDVAEEVGAPILSNDALKVRTFAGTAPVKASFVRRMEIGSLLFENTPAVVVEASHMALVPDRPSSRRTRIAGIIGWDTIRQLDLSLDYTSGLILIRRPQRKLYSPHNLTWMGKPFVEVRTRRGETLHFTLDTGAQGSFLNAIALDKTGAASTSADGAVFGIGGTGKRAERIVRSLPLELGGKAVRLDGVMVYGPAYSGMIDCDGILGSDISRYGTIRIDATNGLFAIGLNPLRELD